MKKFENRWIKKEDLKDIIELGKKKYSGPYFDRLKFQVLRFNLRARGVVNAVWLFLSGQTAFTTPPGHKLRHKTWHL